MYKFLLFDADETLFDFKRAERAAYGETMHELGVDADETLYRLYSGINDSLWQLLNEGGITREKLAVERWRQYGAQTALNAEPEKVNDIYISQLAACPFLLDGASELCRKLYESGRQLYLITNGIAQVQRGRFSASGLAPYFECCFISEDIGASKPSREYFKRVFAAIKNFEPQNAVVIGDSLTADIKGGSEAGIDTIWYNPEGKAAINGILPTMNAATLTEVGKLILAKA